MWCNSIETVKPAVLKLYLDYSREMHASCSKTIAAGEEEIGWLTGRSKTSWPSTSVSRYPEQCGGSGEPIEQLRQATNFFGTKDCAWRFRNGYRVDVREVRSLTFRGDH